MSKPIIISSGAVTTLSAAESERPGLPFEAIVGIVVGSLLSLLLGVFLAVLVFCLMRCRRTCCGASDDKMRGFGEYIYGLECLSEGQTCLELMVNLPRPLANSQTF